MTDDRHMRPAHALILVVALFLAACQGQDNLVATDITIPSRGVEVPATFVHPQAATSNRIPLVVMAHGHGGTRDEAGAFMRVAEELGKRGIASIRVDFPGCGESTEPFTENFLTNMLADIQASKAFALQHPGIDPERVGILGYSMGGRLAMLASRDADYSAIALWNPVASDGGESMHAFLGGQEAYKQLQAEAVDAGSALLRTPWGAEQQLSRQWFTDMEETRPLAAISDFSGALLVLVGEKDEVVDPEYSEMAVKYAQQSAPLRTHLLEGAGHGLGFYDNNAAMADEVVSVTAGFFEEHL